MIEFFKKWKIIIIIIGFLKNIAFHKKNLPPKYSKPHVKWIPHPLTYEYVFGGCGSIIWL
jgi:hypothetical protein